MKSSWATVSQYCGGAVEASADLEIDSMMLKSIRKDTTLSEKRIILFKVQPSHDNIAKSEDHDQ